MNDIEMHVTMKLNYISIELYQHIDSNCNQMTKRKENKTCDIQYM